MNSIVCYCHVPFVINKKIFLSNTFVIAKVNSWRIYSLKSIFSKNSECLLIFHN